MPSSRVVPQEEEGTTIRSALEILLRAGLRLLAEAAVVAGCSGSSSARLDCDCPIPAPRHTESAPRTVGVTSSLHLYCACVPSSLAAGHGQGRCPSNSYKSLSPTLSIGSVPKTCPPTSVRLQKTKMRRSAAHCIQESPKNRRPVCSEKKYRHNPSSCQPRK